MKNNEKKTDVTIGRVACRTLLAFGAAGLVTGLVLAPAVSQAAKDMRIPCITGQIDQSAPSFTYECMWPDSSDFRASDISDLNLHLIDLNATGTVGAGYHQAKACVSYWHTAGGECGAVANNAAYTRPGHPTLHLSTSKWSTANVGHFKYITRNSNPNVTVAGIFAYIP